MKHIGKRHRRIEDGIDDGPCKRISGLAFNCSESDSSILMDLDMPDVTDDVPVKNSYHDPETEQICYGAVSSTPRLEI